MTLPSSSVSSTAATPATASGGASSPFALLSDDIVLNILAKLEVDPRDWARLACVSARLSSLVRNVCCRSRCYRSLPSDLLPSAAAASSAAWPSLHKISVCCPGLLHAGILLEHSDFGLERDIGPHIFVPLLSSSSSSSSSSTSSDPPNPLPPIPSEAADSCWSLFDDLYFDTVYDHSESQDATLTPIDPSPGEPPIRVGSVAPKKRKKQRVGPVGSHLASGPWSLSREQGNKLLASRFRGDCLYICDWPGCIHAEEKRKYMLFRGVFKNFKRSRVWKTITDSNRGKIALDCAFCACRETWDLHSAFCLRRVFGFHDDGEPVVRAYVCENGHVSGAWTERPLMESCYGIAEAGRPYCTTTCAALTSSSSSSPSCSRGTRVRGDEGRETSLVANPRSEEGSGLLTEPSFSRADFPLDFVFGAGTSSYQASLCALASHLVEGAVSEDGRKPSIWDTFTHAGRMLDKSTGDVASDGYHKYKEDVKLMAETGLDSYRFSISWSRLIPNGRGAVNPKGLQFYNNLIDELVKYGIQPHVSLYHLDHPQALEDDYSGWLSPKMVDDFTAFADVCFKNFGDRVPRWTTIVQPNIMSMGAYDMGTLPPNRCSYPFGIINCTVGNSTTEPYIVVHNVLLAHASIVKLYKSKYQAKQNGWIGINVYTFQYYPLTNSSADIEATQRILEFYVGWILNPLVFGDYPEVMKKIVGSRLPSFTKSQSEQIKGLFDFIGVNHYASVYVKDNINASEMGLRDFIMDSLALMATSRNETPGQYDPTAPSSFDPQGLQYMLEYLRDTYGNPPLFVEENGYGIGRRESSLNDTDRINYLNGFIDVFEFLTGYQSPCGLYHVDFNDENRKRKSKLSASWYSKLLERKDGMKLNKTAMDIEYHARW
ncbi:Phytochrome A-associated F-box [Musa troglodytarum]|uniref:Phytochrome A-associated F-box n=1 Tax=Musa troglodytarum TaxID=320322 RepID=A0A9E7ER40_9LILI|nr:Phytochrome A-associated F-box [Musa troglodytarum]